jgi:hypothetical protein
MTLGFDVFVQLVMAAMSTLPWRISDCTPRNVVEGTCSEV